MNASASAAAGKPPVSIGRWVFRILHWSTYPVLLITLVLALHKAPPPPVATSPQAAARAEEKIQRVQQLVSSGAPATLRMDEDELNSYLSAHLDLSSGALADADAMRSNVRDLKVKLLEDRLRAYVVFDLHGKEMTLELEGRLHAVNGYLQFVPTGGAVGSLPLPQSALESALRRTMEAPQNHEKLKLPPRLNDLRIEQGDVVISFR